MKRLLPERILARSTRNGHETSGIVVTQALDWPGVMLEAGRQDVSYADGHVLTHHYISLLADDTPYVYEGKDGRRFRKVVVPPDGIWFAPANESITTRPGRARSYVRVAIEPGQLDRVLMPFPDAKESLVLRRAYALDAAGISLLLRALAAEAAAGNPAGLAFVEAVTGAIARQLVHLVGVRGAPREPPRGRLSPAAKRRVLELIDAKLDARLTVEFLAREIGLSTAHFARAFRETMGRPPHEFLLSARLARARRMLETPGVALSVVADRTGFADQSHLTRLFKREYGVTPGALVKARRRSRGDGNAVSGGARGDRRQA